MTADVSCDDGQELALSEAGRITGSFELL
jgi:hypothetical protein